MTGINYLLIGISLLFVVQSIMVSVQTGNSFGVILKIGAIVAIILFILHERIK